MVGRILRCGRADPGRSGAPSTRRKALDARGRRASRPAACVLIYPEGTTTKEPDLWPMRGKTGAARLWLATGAPVVPGRHVGPGADLRPAHAASCGRCRARRSPWSPGRPIDLSPLGRGAADHRRRSHEITDTSCWSCATCWPRSAAAPPPPLWIAHHGPSHASESRRAEQWASRRSAGWPCSAPVRGAPRSPRCSPTPGRAVVLWARRRGVAAGIRERAAQPRVPARHAAARRRHRDRGRRRGARRRRPGRHRGALADAARQPRRLGAAGAIGPTPPWSA